MVQWLFCEIMADHEMDPKDVVPKFRRHSVYGWGTFKCNDCRLSWSSQIAWVTLDIKEQRIRRRFKQKCKNCGTPQRPFWRIDELAFMMELALERYQKLVQGTWQPSGRPLPKSVNAKAPHKSELCERCGFGARECWKIPDNPDEEKKNGEVNGTEMTIKENDTQMKNNNKSRDAKPAIKTEMKPVKQSTPKPQRRVGTNRRISNDRSTKTTEVSTTNIEKIEPNMAERTATKVENPSVSQRKESITKEAADLKTKMDDQLSVETKKEDSALEVSVGITEKPDEESTTKGKEESSMQLAESLATNRAENISTTASKIEESEAREKDKENLLKMETKEKNEELEGNLTAQSTTNEAREFKEKSSEDSEVKSAEESREKSSKESKEKGMDKSKDESGDKALETKVVEQNTVEEPAESNRFAEAKENSAQ